MKKKELKLAWHYLTLIRAAQEDNNLDELSGLLISAGEEIRHTSMRL